MVLALKNSSTRELRVVIVRRVGFFVEGVLLIMFCVMRNANAFSSFRGSIFSCRDRMAVSKGSWFAIVAIMLM